jgi:hypothetical protein
MKRVTMLGGVTYDRIDARACMSPSTARRG